MIKAVTIAGHESQYAASVSSVFSLHPSPVRDLQCRQSEDDRSRLMLQWSRVEDGDLKGYEVRIGDKWETSEALPLTGELYASYQLRASQSIRIMIMTIPFRYASRHKTVTKEYAPDVAKQSLLK